MNTSRKNAVIVGAMYIIGTLGGVLSLVFTQPARTAPDLLTYISANESQIVLGAISVLIMGLALAMVPVAAFPVLRKHNELLALGYVVFRSGLEAVCYAAMAVSWLFLPPLSHVYQAGAPDASNLEALGNALFKVSQVEFVLTIAFSLGALMFYAVLYQSKLVPRWLSGVGFLVVVLSWAANLLPMLGLVSPGLPILSFMEMPLFVQEMVLAGWLIVKGFNPSAIAAGSANQIKRSGPAQSWGSYPPA
jgi:Domain of unknown function (DUF4386)